jgi:hypothetical protein
MKDFGHLFPLDSYSSKSGWPINEITLPYQLQFKGLSEALCLRKTFNHIACYAITNILHAKDGVDVNWVELLNNNCVSR